MAFLVRFTPKAMDSATYDEINRRLDAANADVKGRLYHVAFGDKNALNVIDIWDTMENFAAFGNILMPIVQSLGIDPGQPEIIEVYNIIKG